jgi:hypothetical protein
MARRRTARAEFGGGAANPIAFVFIEGHVRHLTGNWLHNCGSVRILKFAPSGSRRPFLRAGLAPVDCAPRAFSPYFPLDFDILGVLA